jgi:hypothetical protein
MSTQQAPLAAESSLPAWVRALAPSGVAHSPGRQAKAQLVIDGLLGNRDVDAVTALMMRSLANDVLIFDAPTPIDPPAPVAVAAATQAAKGASAAQRGIAGATERKAAAKLRVAINLQWILLQNIEPCTPLKKALARLKLERLEAMLSTLETASPVNQKALGLDA